MSECQPHHSIDDEHKAERALMHIAEQLDIMFNGEDHDVPAATGFLLLVAYPLGDEDRCSLVSNMDSHDILAQLKLQIARLEGQSFQHGHA